MEANPGLGGVPNCAGSWPDRIQVPAACTDRPLPPLSISYVRLLLLLRLLASGPERASLQPPGTQQSDEVSIGNVTNFSLLEACFVI